MAAGDRCVASLLSMASMSDFDGQFRIATEDTPVPDGAFRRRLGGISVDIFDLLPVCDVFDRFGRLIGLLLGMPIDTDAGTVLGGSYVFDANLPEQIGVEALVEACLYRLAGSFVFILAVAGFRRLYLDANGTKSAVYDAAARVAAATAALLLDPSSYLRRLDTSLRHAVRADNDGWFPAGLTAHEGVQRLTCNHFLDLDRWEAVRHWPSGPIERDSTPERCLGVVVTETRRTIELLSAHGEGCMALTAGYDTRLLLACSRPVHRDIRYVTVREPSAELDVVRSGELACRFGLRHELLPYIEACDAEKDRWLRKVGHSVAGSNLAMHPSTKPLEGKIFMGGVGGEVGRGALWLNSDDDTRLSVEGLLLRLRLPRHPLLCERVDAWLQPLKGLNSLLILDLAFMELRVSSWAFAQAYALPRVREINPLISRRNYEAMLSLPVEFRANQGMFLTAFRELWPELLSLPVNRYGDWRDRCAFVRKAVSHPGRAWRKLKRRSCVKFGNAVGRLMKAGKAQE
ncbi:hypothetical protein [Mesorhizobium sp. SP-1A]|uniref:hypothetical protein n=1 Tax=Mesorhizobium sp. SP-1A TaxID=3077840 RepID=UPI0028F70728|nr:hypothetical protein [Mesorhizobium sp. SP-1A]